jgi:hypothetical protein
VILQFLLPTGNFPHSAHLHQQQCLFFNFFAGERKGKGKDKEQDNDDLVEDETSIDSGSD